MNPLFLLLGFFGANAAVKFRKANNDEDATQGGPGRSYPKGKPVDDDTTPSEPISVSNDTDQPETTDTTPVQPVGEDTTDTTDPAPAPPVEEDTTDTTDLAPVQPVEEDTTDTTGPAPVQPVGEDTTDTTGTTPAQPVEEDTTDDTTSGPDFTPVDIVTPEQDGPSTDGADTTSSLVADGNVSVMAGRVATLNLPGDDIIGVEITSDVDHGNLSINPDGSLALVMTQSDFTGSQSFSYSAQHADGSTSTHTVNLNVTSGVQAQGWGTSEDHYMLATDENDNVVVEHGEIHTKVYVSASNSALSRADIAQAEGVTVSQVTGQFLASNGYGQSEGLALDEDAGMTLWNHVSPDHSETSNWLLLESGYEYDELGRILGRGVSGESEMNPLYIGAWGEGSKPEISDPFDLTYPYPHENIVVQGVHFSDGSLISQVNNLMFDDVTFTNDEVAIMSAEGVTIRNSDFYDIYREVSQNGGEFEAHTDRIQGLFMNNADGVVIEGNFFDLNGWSPDGHDPSMFSHNMYFGADMDDVTVRDNIFMRGASYGAQIRSGGFIEDNVFIDNNAALSSVGGDYEGAGPAGNYTLMSDNLVTSGAHKEGELIGALAMGIYETGEMTAMVDNIVTHLADPNNEAEQAAKVWNHHANYTEDTVYDDTIVYNWKSSHELHGDNQADQNTAGLDTSVLDETTIQQFAAQLLGNPNATIADLADYLRGQADGALDDVVDADLIIDFFQTGFGVAADIRDEATTLRFVPSELSDGVRWDNRLNWDTEDLPGLHAADSVDLGGNHVVFGTNAEINSLDLGDDGALTVYGGRLDANGGLTGDDTGTLTLEGAGQIWAGGSDAFGLGLSVDGGRFVNTGHMEGADLTATDGQTILATGGASYEVSDGDTLKVADGDAQVGFDGDDGGMAVLDLDAGSTIAFAAENGGGLGTIEEFRSGAFEDTPDVQSGIDLGDAMLSIDLAGLSAADGTQFTLMDADEIIGLFDDTSVTGLGGRNAKIVIDYEGDTVTLELTSGNGSVAVETIGQESDVTASNSDLWDVLTADQGLASDTALAQLPGDDDDMIEDGLLEVAA